MPNNAKIAELYRWVFESNELAPADESNNIDHIEFLIKQAKNSLLGKDKRNTASFTDEIKEALDKINSVLERASVAYLESTPSTTNPNQAITSQQAKELAEKIELLKKEKVALQLGVLKEIALHHSNDAVIR